MYEAKKREQNLQLLNDLGCNSANKPSFQMFMIFWGCQGGICLKDMHFCGWESAFRNA